eukprot:1158092-Pelagomonas_calceolata.AAC.7
MARTSLSCSFGDNDAAHAKHHTCNILPWPVQHISTLALTAVHQKVVVSTVRLTMSSATLLQGGSDERPNPEANKEYNGHEAVQF